MSIARALSWPIRRLLDPRFKGIAEQADAQHDDLARRLDLIPQTVQQEMASTRKALTTIARADLDASQEANELIGRSLGDLLAEVDALSAQLSRAGWPASPQDGVDATVEALDAGTAHLLNYASGHTGFAAQRGLWFNPPVSLLYEQGQVRSANINERIVELPYVFGALTRAKPDASILDVGAAESTLALSLASLGYEVTALDLRPYPLTHPNLRTIEADILEWDPGINFDVVTCISTLEHVGLGAYGDNSDRFAADTRAFERIHALTRPGGMLVLTVPFGPASADESQRSYDHSRLDRLLERWTTEDVTVVRRADDLTWVTDAGDGQDAPEARRVALVTATRPAD